MTQNSKTFPYRWCQLGLIIFLSISFSGCAGSGSGGGGYGPYYGGYYDTAPDVYFGGDYGRGRFVHDYSHRGFISRSSAYRGGTGSHGIGGGMHSGGGFHGGGAGGHH